MKWASASLVFVLLAYFPISTLTCAATSSAASAVTTTTEATTTTEVTTTTEMTTTTIQPCNPATLTLGTADGMSMIDVVVAAYSANDLTMTATAVISCTADANMNADMSFNGGALTPIESDMSNPMQTISVTLTCSYDTMQWSYSATVGGNTVTVPVTEITCGQA